MPYALFGTCLGAIVAYELARCAERAGLPLPVALFTAAVSPPNLYAEAVAQLYAAPGSQPGGPDLMAEVLQKLQDWQSLPKGLVLQVHTLLSLSIHCLPPYLAWQPDAAALCSMGCRHTESCAVMLLLCSASRARSCASSHTAKVPCCAGV